MPGLKSGGSRPLQGVGLKAAASVNAARDPQGRLWVQNVQVGWSALGPFQCCSPSSGAAGCGGQRVRVSRLSGPACTEERPLQGMQQVLVHAALCPVQVWHPESKPVCP